MNPTGQTSLRHHRLFRCRWIALATAGLLIVGAGCGDSNDSDPTAQSAPDQTSFPVPDTTTASTEPATSDTPTSTSAPDTEPATTTVVATDVENADNESRIAQASAVAATSQGVFIADGYGDFTIRVLDDTTQGLALLASDLVVYQASTGEDYFRTQGPILVATNDRTEEFTDGDRRLTLHDVGTIDGKTKILASSEFARPANPDQANHRLLIIDVNDVINGSDVEVTDIGSFGGWEEGVDEARFGDDAISLVHSISASSDLEVIEYDGTIRHDIPLPSERNWSLVDVDGSVWVTDASFAPPDFDEFLEIRQVDLTDGSVRETTIDVDFSGIDREADGFCNNVDVLDGLMVCDQTRGAPFTFPIDGDPVATLIPGLDDGTVRYRSSQ